MRNKDSKYKIIFSATILVLVVGIVGSIYFFRSKLQTTIQVAPTPVAEQSIKDGCTRTERLENDPQYDRALSLINQRIGDNEKWCDENCESSKFEETLRFHQFPANLTNCIKIIQQDIGGDAEGYFTFHSEDIKSNYFPITVDDSYRFSDDTLTSLLITHEMTHVQQYLDSLNGKDTLSCRDKEVEAFISQIDFYVLLSNEEIKSVLLKMNEEKEDKHPQVVMIKTMIEINKNSTCKLFDYECKRKNLRTKLFELITEDPGYRHQCDL